MFLLIPFLGEAQDTTVAEKTIKKVKNKKDPNAPKNWELNGYLKYLTAVYFMQQPTHNIITR